MHFTRLSFLSLFIFIFTTGFLFDGCKSLGDAETTDSQVAEQTDQMMSEANKQVGMPNINNWNQKKIVRDLYELLDQEGLQTHTYIVNMHGEKIYLGRSIGYGIPASVQFSNPEKIAKDAGDFGQYADDIKMPQPEPNGLFMPEGLDATWVFLLDGDGNPRPVYLEPQILVSPFKLH